MRSTTSRKWSEQDDDYIRKNISDGSRLLAERFNVSIPALRKRCHLIGVSLLIKKDEPRIEKRKADNSEKFNPTRHKIKNSSTVGKIAFKIPSEKMTVYICPTKDSPTYRRGIIDKYANRHKPIV